MKFSSSLDPKKGKKLEWVQPVNSEMKCHIFLDTCRTSPVVVHCSDGVGGTGTVIGLDTIANAIDANLTTLDVYGVVYNMRKDRCFMVRYFYII